MFRLTNSLHLCCDCIQIGTCAGKKEKQDTAPVIYIHVCISALERDGGRKFYPLQTIYLFPSSRHSLYAQTQNILLFPSMFHVLVGFFFIIICYKDEWPILISAWCFETFVCMGINPIPAMSWECRGNGQIFSDGLCLLQLLGQVWEGPVRGWYEADLAFSEG